MDMEDKRVEELKSLYKLNLSEFDQSEGNVIKLPKNLRVEEHSVWCEGMPDEYKDVVTRGGSIALKSSSDLYKEHLQEMIDDFVRDASKEKDKEIRNGFLDDAIRCRVHYQQVQEQLIIPEVLRIKEEEKAKEEEKVRDEVKSDVKDEKVKEEVKEEIKEKEEVRDESDYKYSSGRGVIIYTNKADDKLEVSCVINGVNFETAFSFSDVPELKDYSAKDLNNAIVDSLSQWDMMKDLRQRQRSEAGEYLYEERSMPNRNPMLWRDILESSSRGWLNEEERLQKKYQYTKGLLETKTSECSEKYNKFMKLEKSYGNHLEKMDEPRRKFHSMISYSLARSIKNNKYETVRRELRQLESYKVKRNNFLRKFPFGGSIAKAINKVHDFFDDIRVSMHISAGTKVDINKPIKDMNNVERLFCRVNLRQEIKTIQMEEMTDIRGKLNRAYSPVKEREAVWVDECRKERERLKGIIDENIKKSTPIIEKDKTKTKERPSRDM